jgi:hypothetical protein
MPNANLAAQLKFVQVGQDESLQTELDIIRSEYGVFKTLTDSTAAAEFTVATLPSNRIFHAKTILLATLTGTASRVDFYDNSTGGVNTMGSLRLNAAASIADGIYLTDVKGWMFSTGYIVARASTSNVNVFLGGVIRPKMGYELQSALAPLP